MARLKQFSSRHACYYCGANPPSEREHVPPKSLFKGTRYSSITVPSCDIHNHGKHGQDQGFVAALASGVQALRRSERSDDAESSPIPIPALSASLEQVSRVGTMRRYVIDLPEEIDTSLPYFESSVELYEWISFISAGFTWAKIGPQSSTLEWPSAIVRSPNLVQSKDSLLLSQAADVEKRIQEVNEMALSLEWRTGWYNDPHGYPPDVYHYSVSSLPISELSPSPNLVFRHRFFGCFTFFLLIDCPDQILSIVLS